ncbi:MAG: hypothetical protein IIW66_02770 [Bacteroidales bacterium]|nr:hypothetical protein [Bacteroidales bacterium]MBQ5864300.1 hypothetical protein [Bacteroidales bacterium]
MDKIGNITLYNADCMEVMKSFSDIEMDKTYYDKAKKRLQEEVMQGSLFIPNAEQSIKEVSLF